MPGLFRDGAARGRARASVRDSDPRRVASAVPLPHHPHARQAAAAALSVLHERGPEAFWKAHDALFENAMLGLDLREIDAVVSSSGAERR